MAAPILDVLSISKTFGGLTAVRAASFDVAEGSITGLIGPNGAGKTTMFALISGFETPTEGSVALPGGGRDRSRCSPVVAALGIARTFQIVQPLRG